MQFKNTTGGGLILEVSIKEFWDSPVAKMMSAESKKKLRACALGFDDVESMERWSKQEKDRKNMEDQE